MWIHAPGESFMASGLALGWLRLTTAGALPAVLLARAEKAQMGRLKSPPEEGAPSKINGSVPAPAQSTQQLEHLEENTH